MSTTVYTELTIEDVLAIEYAVNTAIDHIEFLKTLHVNLPELKPDSPLVSQMISVRDKCKEAILA